MPNIIDLIIPVIDGELSRQTLCDFTYGKVTCTNPLVIQPPDKMPLPESYFILSALCRPFTAEILGQKITLWRGLEKGDSVRMIRAHGGGKYYVIDREGEL